MMIMVCFVHSICKHFVVELEIASSIWLELACVYASYCLQPTKLWPLFISPVVLFASVFSRIPWVNWYILKPLMPTPASHEISFFVYIIQRYTILQPLLTHCSCKFHVGAFSFKWFGLFLSCLWHLALLSLLQSYPL